MVEISEENFEELVSEALDALPEDMVGGLDNVVFMVEDRNEVGRMDMAKCLIGSSSIVRRTQRSVRL